MSMSNVEWLGEVEWLGDPVSCFTKCGYSPGIPDPGGAKIQCLQSCYAGLLDTVLLKYKALLVEWSRANNGPELTPKYGEGKDDVVGPWDCLRDGRTLSAFSVWWNEKQGGQLDVGSVSTSGACKDVLSATLALSHQAALDEWSKSNVFPMSCPEGQVWNSASGKCEAKKSPVRASACSQLCQGKTGVALTICLTNCQAAESPPVTTTSAPKKTPWGWIVLGGLAVAGAAAWAMGAFGGGLAGAASNPRMKNFWKGQAVTLLPRQTEYGHVVGYDPDGSVLVKWAGTNIVSGVRPENLKGVPPGYAGRASNPRKRVLSPPYSSVSSKYGAPMGRGSDSPSDFEGSVTVKEVPLEGDYDPGGAYWGGGPGTQPLFVAYDAGGHARYTRASSLAAARTKFSNEGLQVEAKSDVNLDVFFNAYVEAALFTSDDSDGTPLDRNYSSGDFTKDALKKMRRDADSFAKAHAALIVGKESQAGHDFWLTRNGHGAGFWDGDWPEPAASILDKAAEAYGEQYLEVYRKKITVM